MYIANASSGRSKETPHFNSQQRPPYLRTKVNYQFERFRKNLGSDWKYYNGSKGYDLVVDDYDIVKEMIKHSPNQKIFRVLDVGAGNFQWGDGLMKYITGLQKTNNLRTDFTLQIISLRAERSFEPDRNSGPSCYHYRMGASKIEEISTVDGGVVEKLGSLKNEVDLIVSRWSFCHFVDPLGTFVSTYDLLRPHTGFMLIDGFFFTLDTNREDINTGDQNMRMMQFLCDLDATFLAQNLGGNRSLNRYVIQKHHEELGQIPMSYYDTVNVPRSLGYCIDSENVVVFHRTTDARYNLELPRNDCIVGDENLYMWLNGRDLFLRLGHDTWQPPAPWLKSHDLSLENPSWHGKNHLGHCVELPHACLADIEDWIEAGKYVVLHYDTQNAQVYYRPADGAANIHYVDVNVNPQFSAGSDWPSDLESDGFASMAFNEKDERLKHVRHRESFRMGYMPN